MSEISGAVSNRRDWPDGRDPLWARWERRLDARRVLELDPSSPIAIKRDVHTFDVDAPPDAFVDAFHRVLMDPDRRFGLVRVMRKRARLGKPFEVGERFQGRFTTGVRYPLLARFAPAAAEAVLWPLESELTSDFGEITQLKLQISPQELEPQYRLEYRYLEGSYIAGSSAYVVQPVPGGGGRCRVSHVFEYQEIRMRYVLWLGTSVMRMHSQVVYSQVRQAADRLGARILVTDVPEAYRNELDAASRS
jgi:hypothetical protein